MNTNQEYLVPTGFGEAQFVEKRSRFIGRVWPAAKEADALARIAETREKHWDATHNVYAYVIKDGPTRFSDDGEPQGTSGMPVLNVFRNSGVFNVCCVVTRYYGGILLGAGGLVRAYSAAAKAALDEAGLSVMRRWSVVLLACPYALFEPVKTCLARHGGIVESTDFGVDVTVEAVVPATGTESCLADVRDLSSGRVEPEVMDVVFKSVSV